MLGKILCIEKGLGRSVWRGVRKVLDVPWVVAWRIYITRLTTHMGSFPTKNWGIWEELLLGEVGHVV
jgi:hypothetical protein